MTNYEKIKNMSVEEMIEAMLKYKKCWSEICEAEKSNRIPLCNGQCKQGIMEWLNKEVIE